MTQIERLNSYLCTKISQEEIQQERLALPEGSGDRHNHHFLLLNPGIQENFLQFLFIEFKDV